jgi:two-component system, NtrC family, nitrogen regulation sensor histidine kinase NtrY
VKNIPFTQSFAIHIGTRIAMLLFLFWGCALWQRSIGPQRDTTWLWSLCAVLATIIGWSLYRYVGDTNRRLTRFLESVRYSDFAVRFSSVAERGNSFEQLNLQFNEVLEAFRQTRAEKEANLLFMNAIVQHLSVGVLAFDSQNALLLSNNSAFQLLGAYRFSHLDELPGAHRVLVDFVENLRAKGKILYQPESGQQISVQGVALNLQGRNVRIITLQNIHNELQRKEVDAWRDLTRVLRHEIMNSVTPIVTIVETMQLIVDADLPPSEVKTDLEEALDVVATRGRSLMDFVEAYRTFSSIPQPRLEQVPLKKIVEQATALVGPDFKVQNIHFKVEWESNADIMLQADPGQIEMVLLNILKNAKEAVHGQVEAPSIVLRAGVDGKGSPFIAVEDNGPGMSPELLEEIFIPFFTTKATGTGVGLSISKQIMQLHKGDLYVFSTVGKGSRFVLGF